MGPGPKYGCEECLAGSNHGMAKRKALKNKLTSIKGFGEGDPKKD